MRCKGPTNLLMLSPMTTQDGQHVNPLVRVEEQGAGIRRLIGGIVARRNIVATSRGPRNIHHW